VGGDEVTKVNDNSCNGLTITYFYQRSRAYGRTLRQDWGEAVLRRAGVPRSLWGAST